MNSSLTLWGSSAASVAVLALAVGAAAAPSAAGQSTNLGTFADRCAALGGLRSPATGAIDTAALGETRFEDRNPFASHTLALPSHCEIKARFPARAGRHGQTYAIKYHVRLPENWNGKFLFQGGGGTNGELGSAIGPTGMGNQPALIQGYAVVSQDSGHDNMANSDPAWGGTTVYGSDAQARRDYGHSSLPKVARAAKDLMRRLYGAAPRFSYFYGCSKGGQEGMAFAQRYPDMFDGIVAAAPGFSLPRAAVAQAWDTQTFASLWRPANGKLTPGSFAALYSEQDFAIVRDTVTKSCDALDGLEDGIIGAFAQCTRARILPELRKRACAEGAGEGAACIVPEKIEALARSLDGPRDEKGAAIYTDWPWDTGIGTPGWSFWKLGSAQLPSFNILTGGASLPTVFMVPARRVGSDPQSLLDFQMAFRFPREAGAIYATSREFPRSAWQDIAMRSPNLDRFRAHGGKLIVPHGVSDPVFSINDTLRWQGEVDARYRGDADNFVRVFPIPGMAHCGGGPATDQFDAFTALTDWVENGKPPASIAASAGAQTPWPGRSRPLCPYPQIAVYDGRGSLEDKGNFRCEKR